MATGIGEASGISLATTLTTYVEDAKNAPEEIASLAQDIDATLRLVDTLDTLLLENEQTKSWNENGVIAFKKCRSDAERIIKKIIRILAKSKTDLPENGTIERADINLTLFKKINWLRLKPRIEVVKQELARTSLDISLALDIYAVKSSTSPAKQDIAKARMIGTLSSKRRVKNQLRLARKREEEILSQPATRSPAHPAAQPSAYQPDDNNPWNEVLPNPPGVVNHRDLWEDVPIGDTTNKHFPTNDEDMRDIMPASQGREHISAKGEERQKETSDHDAVERYKKALIEDLSKYQQQLEESMEEMRKALDPPPSEEQIRLFAEKQHAKEIGGEVGIIWEAFNLRNKSTEDEKNSTVTEDLPKPEPEPAKKG